MHCGVQGIRLLRRALGRICCLETVYVLFTKSLGGVEVTVQLQILKTVELGGKNKGLDVRLYY